MFIPVNYNLGLAMMIVSLICWGSWANAQKLANWRFEYFYIDYSLGVLLASIAAAFTLGSYGSQGTSFIENLWSADLSRMAYAVFSGVAFNVANYLLVAAIAMAGMAVAFPIAIGIATVLGGGLNYLIDPQGDPLLFSIGMIMMIVAICIAAKAYSLVQNKTTGNKRRGLVVSLCSGALMGFWSPIIARSYDSGSGSLEIYGAFVFMGLGILMSTFIFIPLMMRKPITGENSITLQPYWEAPGFAHFGGLLGGIIWGIGTISFYLASTVAGTAVAYTFGQGAPLVATAWGVFVWKEFKGVPAIKTPLIALFSFYIAGLVLLTAAGAK